MNDPSRRKVCKQILSSLALASPLGSVLANSLANLSPESLVNKVLDHINRLQPDARAFRFLAPEGSEDNLKPLMTLLAEKTRLSVELVTTHVDEVNTRLLLASSGSERFDLALPPTFGIPDLANRNAIQPVDIYRDRYQPENFKDDALYTLGNHFLGRTYGYQADGDVYLMFYNKSWLENEENQKRYSDRFGEDLKVPFTWEQLDRQMMFFHDPEQGRYGGSLYRNVDYLFWEWWARFHSKGYFPFTDDMKPQISNDAGIEALEEMISVSGYLSPGSKVNGLFANWREYSAGNCYANIGWGGTAKAVNRAGSAMRGNVVFAPLPGGTVDGELLEAPYFNWGWNYTVPVTAHSLELSYLVSLLAVTPEVSIRSVREDGFFDPFRESHYVDPGIREIYTDDFIDAHRHSMKNAIPDLYLSGRGKYINVLSVNLDRAFSGVLSARAALETADLAWQGLTLRYGREAQLEQWQRLKASYPAAIRNRLKS